MQIFGQGILEFLQRFFMLVGSLVTFGVLFYLGIALTSRYDYRAKQRAASMHDPAAEKRIDRYALAWHVLFWVLSIAASIGVIAFNFAYVGILGGIVAILGCLTINMFALVD